MNQRDKMRELFNRFGNHEDILIREYALAEKRGEVKRTSNQYKISAEAYAAALLKDARRKGWIPGFK
jgi:hypothetical protein